MALTDGDADEHSYEVGETGSEWTSIASQLRQGYLNRDLQLELDLTSYVKTLPSTGATEPEPEKEPPVWFDLCINRQSPKEHSFFLGGSSFNPDSTLGSGAQRPRKWSDGLRPSDRRRLAKALQIIRDEKNRNRLLGLYPPRQPSGAD